MWICARCGEPHADNFKVCWKCAGDEMTEHVTAPPSASPVARGERAQVTERKLRSFGSILVRAVVAAAVGSIGGAAFFHRDGATLEDAIMAGAVAGAAVGSLVGIFIWVVFPYEPIRVAKPVSAPDEQSRNLPD